MRTKLAQKEHPVSARRAHEENYEPDLDRSCSHKRHKRTYMSMGKVKKYPQRRTHEDKLRLDSSAICPHVS